MLRHSLTVKILVAVGLTVASVISIYTYFVIRVQSGWWYERTQSQNVLATAMVGEHLQGVMLNGRGPDVQSFLLQLQKSEEILQGRIIKTDGEIIFSTKTQEVHQAWFKTPPELFASNRVLHGTRTENGVQIAMAMAPIHAQPACARCHDPKQEVIGAVVLEKSMAPARASLAENRALLVAYGLVIFVLVGVVLWLLIVRFVAQPVRGVLQQMQRVQQGDLSARATVDSQDEVGKLAVGFNAMVESLDGARRELHESHEKQIQQAGKLASIGELAAGIAHEIRNPLAGIGSAVAILAETSGGNSQYAEVAGEIHQQIGRLNRTLRDLLEFARPREPEIEPCDVHEIIKPMLALVRTDSQKHQIQIVEDFDSQLPPIRADAQQIQQAILNVLLNATQAMPSGGRLTVKTELRTSAEVCSHGSHAGADGEGDASAPAPWIRITIRDTGVGIPRETLGKIFSPFYTTKHRGTGLGLSITRTIVDKHQGTIRVDSELGCGTTFTLEFVTCPCPEPSGEGGTPGVAAAPTDTVGKEVLSHV